MGLDRAPIEFQTFYFFHVWLDPPNHHHHPKWRWCYKILLVWAQPLSPAGLPQTPFIKWWTSPHKQLAENYENDLTTYQALKMIWLQNRLRSND